MSHLTCAFIVQETIKTCFWKQAIKEARSLLDKSKYHISHFLISVEKLNKIHLIQIQLNSSSWNSQRLKNWSKTIVKKENPHFLHPFSSGKNLGWLLWYRCNIKATGLIVISHRFVINTVGWESADLSLSLHEGVRGEGSRTMVIFADLPLDVRQFGPEIFTPLLLNLVVWGLQRTGNNSNN